MNKETGKQRGQAGTMKVSRASHLRWILFSLWLLLMLNIPVNCFQSLSNWHQLHYRTAPRRNPDRPKLASATPLFTAELPDFPPSSRARSRRDWLLQNAVIPGVASLGGNNLLFPQRAFAEEQAATAKQKTPYLLPEYFNPPKTAPQMGRSYFPTILPPFQNRATYLYDLGRQTYALEQLLAFQNVTATIRTSVIQLESGGLWVHSPQYPTGELCYLLDSIGAPVQHIVLPCNALEHKAPMKEFVKKYPNVQVWISPGQYGPFGSCGLAAGQDAGSTDASRSMGYEIAGILGDSMPNLPPWLDEFDLATLYVDIPENAGPVSEVAFCHKPTKTLVATDAVAFIPEQTPEIFSTYFDASTISDKTFWARTVLQAVFLPLRADSAGNYPGYEALRGRLVRAPILRAFADARAPTAVQKWVSKIANFKFDRIVTSHFASPVAATPTDFANCFIYLQQSSSSNKGSLPPIACQDWELLQGLNEIIADNKLGAPATFNYKPDCGSY